MYYCLRCKAELPEKARYCVKCGYQRKPQQFVGPAFLPSPRQRPDTHHISEQQTQQIPVEVVKGRPRLIEAHDDFNEIEDNFESYVATSLAAEHWRTSWRNRQRSEAGPAASVSRGHSAVPEPLMAMQHSLARMRAIIAPSSKQNKRNANRWISILLVAFLILGLGALIVSTYLH